MSLELLNFKTFVDTKVKNKLINFNALLENEFKNSTINCSTFSNDFENFVRTLKTNLFIDLTDEGKMLVSMLNENERTQAVEYMQTTITTYMQMNNIVYQNIMHQCELENFKKNPLYLSGTGRVFEFVMRGDVKITKIKKRYDSNYKITFSRVNKILTYQVHKSKNEIIPLTHLPEHPNTSDDHPRRSNDVFEYIKNNSEKVVVVDFDLNKNRNVRLSNIDEFISDFNSVENFKPTTVMEIGYKKYVFVINNVKKNYNNNRLVFYISTKEIRLVGNFSNNLTKILPLGMHKRVRIDIDDYEVYGNSISCPLAGPDGNTTCYCPGGSTITTMGAVAGVGNAIVICRKRCRSDYPDLVGGICYSICTDGAYEVGPCCWKHWYDPIFGLDFPYSPGCKSTLIPESFAWNTSNGRLCIADYDTPITNRGRRCNTIKDNKLNDSNTMCKAPTDCCPANAECE